MGATGQVSQWLGVEPLLAFCVAALIVYVWAHRRRRNERARHDEHVTQLEAEHRRHLAALEERGHAETARLQQKIVQQGVQHRDALKILERRLEQQALFDPHRWLAEARALRTDGSEVGAMDALRAGIARTQDATCETYLELALHHFVLQAGVPTAEAVAHLHAAERYTQLASLLKPEDRAASLLTDDVAAAMESQQVRVGHTSRLRPDSSGAQDSENEFLGAPEQRAVLVNGLADEAAARERAGRFLVAERLAYRALAIARHAFGDDAEPTIAVRYVYARSLLGNGAYTDALREIEAALAACARLNHGDVSALRVLRADVQGRLGRWELALADLDALLIVSTRQRGVEHHDTLHLRREHALALHALGHGEAALHEIDATLAMLDRIDDPEEPEITRAHAARAEILIQLGRSAEAFEQLERVLPIAERVFGVESPVALSIRWQLALALHRLHRNDEALDDIEALLSSQEYVFGAQHPLVLQSAALRARIMHALGREQEALLEAKRLLPLHASSFGDNHRDTVQLYGLLNELEAA